MKKALAMLLIAATAVSAFGCGSKNSSAESSDRENLGGTVAEAEAEEETAEADSSAIEEVLDTYDEHEIVLYEMDGYKLTYNSCEVYNSEPGYEYEDHDIYLRGSVQNSTGKAFSANVHNVLINGEEVDGTCFLSSKGDGLDADRHGLLKAEFDAEVSYPTSVEFDLVIRECELEDRDDGSTHWESLEIIAEKHVLLTYDVAYVDPHAGEIYVQLDDYEFDLRDICDLEGAYLDGDNYLISIWEDDYSDCGVWIRGDQINREFFDLSAVQQDNSPYVAVLGWELGQYVDEDTKMFLTMASDGNTQKFGDNGVFYQMLTENEDSYTNFIIFTEDDVITQLEISWQKR